MWLLAATQILPCLSEASSIDILTVPVIEESRNEINHPQWRYVSAQQ